MDGDTCQDPIACDPAGVEVLDMVLTDVFIGVAPRQVFRLEGETTNPVFTAEILLQLLQKRCELGHREVVVHNPLTRNLEPIRKMDLRLCAAIMTALRDADSIDVCGLIHAAAADGSNIVRCAAMRAAAGFVTIAEVREVVERAFNNEDGLVRGDALEALAPLVEHEEFAESLAWFIGDRQPEIRLRAFRLIMESSGHRPQRNRLLGLAFDPVAKIAEAARTHFSDEDLENYVSYLTKQATEEGLVRADSMKILGSSPLVDPSARDRAFLAQLRQLRWWTAPPGHLADLLRALRPWEQKVGAALRQEIDTVRAETRDPCLMSLKRQIAEGRPQA